jgi:hypothetical protein
MTAATATNVATPTLSRVPIPVASNEHQQGASSMKNTIAAIHRIAADMEAFESLASGMSEGLRAGVVDPAHVYTLVATQAEAIRLRLVALASDMRQRHEGILESASAAG